jgi:hydroxyethylthiazole kinase-like uncharacterized protein yjeF
VKLVSVAEMKAIEAEADQRGISYAEMIDQAGKGLAETVHSKFGQEKPQIITGLVGRGNNGSDTLAALIDMSQMGWEVNAYLVRVRDGNDPFIRRFLDVGGKLIDQGNDLEYTVLDGWLRVSSVVMDGVLGTGVQLPLKDDIAEFLHHVRSIADLPHVIAVDCPSGVDCDSGQAAVECIPAEVTVCMQAVKKGLLQFPAFGLCGKIEVVDLDLPIDLENWKRVTWEVVTAAWVKSHLPVRPLEGHKGTFGTAMVVAGSINYTGAALLASTAAYRIGAGLVRVAAPGPLHAALAGHIPEATWLILPHETGVIAASAAEIVKNNIENVDALLLGPGWGLEETTAEFISRLLSRKKTQNRGYIGFQGTSRDQESMISVDSMPSLIIDADGLKLLKRIPEWQKIIGQVAVLTPHPGEMAVLTGLPVSEIQRNRLEVASRFAREWGPIVVLKGAATIIASPDDRLSVVPIATTALSHAGTGDVLAGIITGLIAQKVPAFEAAVTGVWIHAQAGVLASARLGHPASVMASDVIDSISRVLQGLVDQS